MPGMAASTSDTCALGSPPKVVEAPENSLERDVTWAWISMPTMISQAPVVPWTRLWGLAWMVMVGSRRLVETIEFTFYDEEKRWQALHHCRPNIFFDDAVIIVPVEVTGVSHVTPRNF